MLQLALYISFWMLAFRLLDEVKKEVKNRIKNFKAYYNFINAYYDYLESYILNNKDIDSYDYIIISEPFPMVYLGKKDIIGKLEKKIKKLKEEYEKIKWAYIFDEELEQFFEDYRNGIEEIERKIRIYKWKSGMTQI